MLAFHRCNDGVFYNYLFMTHNSNRGFGLIETIVGISIATIAFLAIGQVSILSLKATQERDARIQAINIAREGIEAARTIRDTGWTDNISNLNFGSTYYLATSSGAWILTGTNPGLINNKFTRTVIVDNVSRDVNDDIVVSGGTNDPGTKKITSTVSWGVGKSIKLVAYITNILND